MRAFVWTGLATAVVILVFSTAAQRQTIRFGNDRSTAMTKHDNRVKEFSTTQSTDNTSNNGSFNGLESFSSSASFQSKPKMSSFRGTEKRAQKPVKQTDFSKLDQTHCVAANRRHQIRNNDNNDNRNHTTLLDATSTTTASSSSSSWQHRAPYAIIIGAMKAGTTALQKYLVEHPRVLPTKKKEQHFFDRHFDDAQWISSSGIMQEPAQQAYQRHFQQQLGTQVAQAKRQRIEQDSPMTTTTTTTTTVQQKQQSSFSSSSLSTPQWIAIDDTPRYLFWSDRIPQRVQCVAPWAKLLVLLRNPVERAYSHYVYSITENDSALTRTMKRQSFEEWIQEDLYAMSKAGLLPYLDGKGYSSNSMTGVGMDERKELEAWSTYVRTLDHQVYSVLGKGLYVLQLLQWFNVLEANGRSPQTDMLVLHSDDLAIKTQQTFDRVTDFLELERFVLPDNEKKHKTHYREEMSNETRKRLELFFAPYNERLYDLLGWDKVWG